MALKKVSIREAKAELSNLLKSVEHGVEVVITNRGRPVGKIVPVVDDIMTVPQWIEKLEREGVLERAPAERRGLLPVPLQLPEGLAQRFLDEDRNR
jgi:prevent-host-death family protein